MRIEKNTLPGTAVQRMVSTMLVDMGECVPAVRVTFIEQSTVMGERTYDDANERETAIRQWLNGGSVPTGHRQTPAPRLPTLRLREVRKMRRMSAATLSFETLRGRRHVTEVEIKALESGEMQPQPCVVAALSDALRVHVEDLLG